MRKHRLFAQRSKNSATAGTSASPLPTPPAAVPLQLLQRWTAAGAAAATAAARISRSHCYFADTPSLSLFFFVISSFCGLLRSLELYSTPASYPRIHLCPSTSRTSASLTHSPMTPPKPVVSAVTLQRISFINQQRNGRKSVTTVQGLPKAFDLKKMVRALKKEFSCNGTVIEDPEHGSIIQLQGDQRQAVKEFLEREGICGAEQLRIHGV
ncbi:LOW QUALITY PROTEIN: translation initiation factor SUI1, putative [Eimeria necatrix]|uniref:Translation initiation factor SUI1, putative n=1 Tax=Eimeria necatrix TaxID=51315 RepID=U6MIV4_9EIME|nr:LOW QUALITY PROTEIN: translation initiation factor SUI1, putative [Eimeria necatrix]CDJ62399.1 translation initiation factor SUI1, putative [Eimeria necatrix]